MTTPNAQTWSWDPEHEPPEAFEDALGACAYAFEADFGGTLIQGYAEKVSAIGAVTCLKRPIINNSDQSSDITLKSRYVQHPSYFIVNCPVLYWPRPRKETP